MSLDIIAYDPKETKSRKDKFKAKYGISYDKFNDEMLEPDEDNFFYYLHPELFESDVEKYYEMEDDAEKIQDVDEIDRFHIGYGHFYVLRKELGELVGVKYDDSDIYYDDKLEDTSLLKFFLHSDCDGSFSTIDIQKSYKQFFNLCNKEKLQDKKNGKWAKEIKDFLKFWKESADQNLQWEFC